MSKALEIVQPTCKYGHGNLTSISENGKKTKWALTSLNKPDHAFTGNLHVCHTCGYTEFFDDDIDVTRGNLK